MKYMKMCAYVGTCIISESRCLLYSAVTITQANGAHKGRGKRGGQNVAGSMCLSVGVIVVCIRWCISLSVYYIKVQTIMGCIHW